MPNPRNFRTGWWCFAWLAFVAITGVLAISKGVEFSRPLYLGLLFAACTSPFIFMRSLNDRYALLWIMMAVYFVLYGASDFLSLLAGPLSPASGATAETEIAIVISAVMLILGYVVTTQERKAHTAKSDQKDWSPAAIFWVGLILWTVGVFATLYWQIKLQTGSFKLAYVSPSLGMAITLGRMMQPLGTALLAYLAVKSRSRLLLILILALLATEFVVGFICDSKELSIRGLIVFLAAKLLVQGRVPKGWLATGALIAVLSFPVFQAYRYEVLGVRGQAREQAARNLKDNLAIAIRSITEPSAYGSSAGPGFIGRVSLKSNVQLVLERVGNTARYQHGYTYLLFLEGFVPRVFWPNKPDTSVGQLFNRELHISAFRDVYISPSYLGEFYWNFGWPGMVIGMFLLGWILGTVGRSVALSEGVTVTRFLVLLLTVYSFCMRFEGGIALEALVWVRSLSAVALLHWIFARARIPANEKDQLSSTDEVITPGISRFENVMS